MGVIVCIDCAPGNNNEEATSLDLLSDAAEASCGSAPTTMQSLNKRFKSADESAGAELVLLVVVCMFSGKQMGRLNGLRVHARARTGNTLCPSMCTWLGSVFRFVVKVVSD